MIAVPDGNDPPNIQGFTVTSAGTYKVSFGLIADDANQFHVQVTDSQPLGYTTVFGHPALASLALQSRAPGRRFSNSKPERRSAS